ncbi:polyprenyl synthetase family protein [Lapillicoccus sp.]|uniref:polyprenyl synthetase family protein n=1 Tax=Lapillicoccus sp. TaxID=1909287 RepID=UPI0025E16533|nr:polyprenyl synthetase family protein [Lapillicoccus sp.]
MNDPLDRSDLRRRVQTAVDAEIAGQRGVLGVVGPDLGILVDAVARLLTGGKRLRAAFLYWGYRAAGQPDSEALVRLATAMEFFQAAALLHDDVMDRSDTRRGMPSAHRAIAGHHAEVGWIGNSDRFGEAAAILAGDLCLQWTDELYSTSGLPAEHLGRARRTFDMMRTQLMGGQYLDILESARGWDGLDTAARIASARNVIRYKSAKYTIEHPLLIGATAGGVPATAIDALSRYGLALGEAFQLRDDLLGVFGDPAQTGKPAGDDLREGKRTVLIALALGVADDEQRALVDKLLGQPDLDAHGVEELRGVLHRTGAVDGVEEKIAARVNEAAAALDGVAELLDPEATEVLHSLIASSTARES